MQVCRADGTLLKPHAPAMNLDSTFSAALREGGAEDCIGVESVWATTMSAGPSSPRRPFFRALLLAACALNAMGPSMGHAIAAARDLSAAWQPRQEGEREGLIAVHDNSLADTDASTPPPIQHLLLFANVSARATGEKHTSKRAFGKEEKP